MRYLSRTTTMEVQDAQGNWGKPFTFSAGYIPFAEKEDTLLEFVSPAGISFNAEFQTESQDSLRELLGSSPVYALEYRIGTKWFMPIIIIPSATLENLEVEEGHNEVSISFGSNSGVVVKYHNWLARPVFWLWQRWRMVRRLIKEKIDA